MIRVLLVDDQELVRSGLKAILQSEPDLEVVGEAANGEEAVTLAESLTPDVICMDIEMPIMNGIEATRRILNTALETSGIVSTDSDRARPAVLVLTTFGHEEYLFDALAAGVQGFLLKTARAEQLIDAVKTVAAGQSLLGPDVTRAVIDRVREAPARVPVSEHSEANASAAAELAGLTEREREVLQLVAKGHSNTEIAAELYLGEATVKTHVSNMLQKLGVRDRIQAIVWAHTNGF